MKTGIVILNYNVSNAVVNLLESIIAFSCIDSIVIVDNHSHEDELNFLKEYIEKKHFSNVKFIASNINLGYAKGNNIGLKYLVECQKCDICFIANPDISFLENDIMEIIKAFKTYKNYAVLTCKREYSDGEKIRQYWNLVDFKTIVLECFSIYRKYEKTKNIYRINSDKEVYDIEVAPGAFWAIRSSVLEKVGYLDENTFLYFEESCFAMKMKLHGFAEGLVTNAKYIVYEEKASTKYLRKNGKGFQYLMESKDFYVKKYLSVGKLKYALWFLCMKYALFTNKIKRWVC